MRLAISCLCLSGRRGHSRRSAFYWRLPYELPPCCALSTHATTSPYLLTAGGGAAPPIRQATPPRWRIPDRRGRTLFDPGQFWRPRNDPAVSPQPIRPTTATDHLTTAGDLVEVFDPDFATCPHRQCTARWIAARRPAGASPVGANALQGQAVRSRRQFVPAASAARRFMISWWRTPCDRNTV